MLYGDKSTPSFLHSLIKVSLFIQKMRKLILSSLESALIAESTLFALVSHSFYLGCLALSFVQSNDGMAVRPVMPLGAIVRIFWVGCGSCFSLVEAFPWVDCFLGTCFLDAARVVDCSLVAWTPSSLPTITSSDSVS